MNKNMMTGTVVEVRTTDTEFDNIITGKSRTQKKVGFIETDDKSIKPKVAFDPRKVPDVEIGDPVNFYLSDKGTVERPWSHIVIKNEEGKRAEKH